MGRFVEGSILGSLRQLEVGEKIVVKKDRAAYVRSVVSNYGKYWDKRFRTSLNTKAGTLTVWRTA